MSDRRWWSIPRVFTFPLWHNSSSNAVANDKFNTVPSSETTAQRCSSSDEEDIEEFLEKQRNVRLSCNEVSLSSSTKSNRKYSDSKERAEQKRLTRSLSKRRSRSSSSKSSDSTKYSSFSKNSDTDNEKVIRETIYEVTSSSPPISFSFFNDANICSTDDTDRVYYNVNNSLPSSTIEEKNDEPNSDVEKDILAKTTTDDQQDDREIVATNNSATAEELLTTENNVQSSTNCRERRITKLTILLSSPREDSEEKELSETDTPQPCNEKPSVEKKEYDSEDKIPLYSVIEKNQSSRRNSLQKASQNIFDELNYTELNEFHSTASGIDKEVTNMEYCNHRAIIKTRLRKISLRRKRKTQPSLRKVNIRINNAWNSIRGWWHEEKIKLKQLRPKSFIAEEHRESPNSSEKSFYESVKHLNLNEVQNSSGDCLVDEDGYCSLELSRETTESISQYDIPNIRRRSCISEIGTMRRNPPQPPPSRNSGINAIRKNIYYLPQGHDGFEELRRYIKQGGDFCKELSVILQERSEAEIQYAKTLSKLSNKLLKASKEAVGTVGQAWHKAGVELETTSEIHKLFATALCEDVVKPLKQLLDSQHRIRKSVENAVDKTGKNLSEWRVAESKSKKQSFVSARENEKLQDITLDVRLSSSLTGSNKLTASSLHLHQKQGSEKECSKLETKRKKAEELVKKSDVEYYTYCVRAERARLEWETAVVRGSQCFQALEEERLQQLKHLAFIYWQHCRDVGPKLTQSALKLKEPIDNCDVNSDIKTIATTKGIEQPVSEQLLPDFYAEHTALAMNRERRRQALVKVLQLVVQDLERERRGKNGVENLARAFKESPNFGNDDSQQNVSEKLHHMRFMLTYLEAARYKISCALAELDGKPKPSHPLASHIHVIRDRQGFQQSILKVPPWVHKETSIEHTEQIESPDWTDRGTADGNSVQPDSDFDEFSSQSSSEKDFDSNVFTVLPDSAIATHTPSSGGKCRALYHYTANLYDELNLQPGDVINIHDKQPDGWWLGELNGVVGIFPATYVEEIS